MGGFCHLYIGQEGVISGIEMLSDKMIVLLRDIGVMRIWLLEANLWKIFSELFGNASDLLKGKGVSICLEKKIIFLEGMNCWSISTIKNRNSIC